MERIAAILKDEARRLRSAWAVRLRSNETALVVSNCPLEEAEIIQKRLAEAFGGIDIAEAIGGGQFRFTASMAVAVWPEDGKDFRQLVEDAYGTLMGVWKAGGNRACRIQTDAGAEASS
jgi:GGDEF domain-containing protein